MRSTARCRLAAFLVATAAVNAGFGAGPALAQESPGEADACFTAAERAQPLVKQKRLREARAELEVCARDVCPRIARTDCRDWLVDVAREQPSIVIAAHEVNEGQNTRDVSGARAIIDGAIVVDRVDPKPIPIDPGVHRLRLEKPGLGPIEQNIEIHEGEKGRVVTFTWRTSWVGRSPPRARDSWRPTPASVYVMSVLGILGLGVGASLEATGLAKRDGELAQCSPHCSPTLVDQVRNITRAGDLSVGVGTLFVLGAGILYLARPTVVPSHADDEVGLIGGPIPGGWMAGIRGTL
jgi:hypothetical protein